MTQGVDYRMTASEAVDFIITTQASLVKNIKSQRQTSLQNKWFQSQFSSVPWPFGSFGGHERQCSRCWFRITQTGFTMVLHPLVEFRMTQHITSVGLSFVQNDRIM